MNRPSDPDSFIAPYRIDLDINIDDMIEDQQRLWAEHWCYLNTRRKWFRRVPKRPGPVEFHFEDLNEATMFRLAN